MFNSGHWVAGIFCIIASVGWILQGGGNAWYYRQVTLCDPLPSVSRMNLPIDMATP